MKQTLLPLTITLLVQALVSMASLTAPVLAPEASAAIGIPTSFIGLFVGLVYVGSMISSLASGDMILRFGAIRVSQICLALCACGLSLATYGTTATLVIGALMIGFGYGPVTPASSHLLSRTTPADRMGLTFSLKQTGVPLGGVLAGSLVPSFIAIWGWRGAAWSVSLACLVMLFITQIIRNRFDSDRDRKRRISIGGAVGPLRMVFRHRNIRSLSLCSFFFSAIQLCLTTYLVAYLVHDYGLPLVAAGLVLAIAQIAGVSGRLIWGWIADHWVAPRRLLGLLGLVMAASAMALSAADPSWSLSVVLIISAFFGATAIGWNGVFLAEIARLSPPGLAASYTGGALFFTYFGVVTGPPCFAGLVTLSGGAYAGGFLPLGIIVMLIGLFLVVASRRTSATRPENNSVAGSSDT